MGDPISYEKILGRTLFGGCMAEYWGGCISGEGVLVLKPVVRHIAWVQEMCGRIAIIEPLSSWEVTEKKSTIRNQDVLDLSISLLVQGCRKQKQIGAYGHAYSCLAQCSSGRSGRAFVKGFLDWRPSLRLLLEWRVVWRPQFSGS